MQKIDGLLTTFGEKYKIEDTMFTYSEEEKQTNEINASNAKLIFSPKFIPFYPVLQTKFDLSNTEVLIFGFIDFYKGSSSNRFYFTNEQIGEIVHCSPDTVSRSISKLESLHLLKTSRKIKAGGGTIRFITEVSYKSDSTFPTSHTRQKLQTNNNKIKDNKIKNGYNGFLNKLPIIVNDPVFIKYLTAEILTQLKDTHSEKFYKMVVMRIPEMIIRQFLQEIKGDGANDPAKLFVYKVKKYAARE